MRQINSIIIHCSATKAGQDFTTADIDRWHRQRGFNGIGYHYVIRLNGDIEKGRDIGLVGAHCKGWNEYSIGICYIGGLDENGQPADTRTDAQKRVLYELILNLQREYNILQVLGHRDTSPDLNGNGSIEPNEYIKSCPCFSVKEFLRTGRELLVVLSLASILSVFLSGCRSNKEIIHKESKIEVDSSSVLNHIQHATEQSFSTENDSEVVEEHVEQTMWVYAVSTPVSFTSPMDSFSTVPGMIVKTVVDRTIGKGKAVTTEYSSIKKDSVQIVAEIKARSSENMNTTIEKKDRSNWLKWSCYTLLLLVLLLTIVVWVVRVIRSRIGKRFSNRTN